MKFAYLISAHTDPAQLNRLIGSLHPNADFYVHIDAKAELRPFTDLIKKTNVHFIEERIDVTWGNISEVRYQMALIRACLASGIAYDYIFFLSGMDYPLWSNTRIAQFMAADPGKQYLQGLSMVGQPDIWSYKYTMYHPFNNTSFGNRWLTAKIRIAGRELLHKLHLRHKKLWFEAQGRRYDLYKGSAWWAITPELARYVLEEFDNNHALVHYFSSSFGPAETLIQTIAFNSTFRARCILSTGPFRSLLSLTPLHYIDYSHGILVFDEKDYDMLIGTGKMFTRKLRSGVSDKLADLIDQHREEEEASLKN